MKVYQLLNIVLISFALTVGVILSCNAQDPTYSIYWNDRTYLNPALCGSDKGLYLATQYRNQWPKLTSKFVTYSVSADIFEPNLYGALGVRAMQNVEGEGVQKTNEFGLNYAYIIPVRSKRTDLAFALGASVYSRVIDPSKLIFSDQLDPVNGNIYATGADLGSIDKATVANFNAGISFRSYITNKSHSFYNIGFSAANITQPNVTLTNQTSRLPIRYTGYLDVTTPMNRLSGRFIYHLKPAAIVVAQRGVTGPNFTSMRIGLIMDSKPITTGLFYKNESFGKISSSMSIPRSSASHEIWAPAAPFLGTPGTRS